MRAIRINGINDTPFATITTNGGSNDHVPDFHVLSARQVRTFERLPRRDFLKVHSTVAGSNVGFPIYMTSRQPFVPLQFSLTRPAQCNRHSFQLICWCGRGFSVRASEDQLFVGFQLFHLRSEGIQADIRRWSTHESPLRYNRQALFQWRYTSCSTSWPFWSGRSSSGSETFPPKSRTERPVGEQQFTQNIDKDVVLFGREGTKHSTRTGRPVGQNPSRVVCQCLLNL